MAKLKKKPISQSEMTHILQRELGYGAAMGTSIFTLMARVLSKRGVSQGSAQKDRDFVYENAERKLGSDRLAANYNELKQLLTPWLGLFINSSDNYV